MEDLQTWERVLFMDAYDNEWANFLVDFFSSRHLWDSEMIIKISLFFFQILQFCKLTYFPYVPKLGTAAASIA
jgi:hypothetical protein